MYKQQKTKQFMENSADVIAVVVSFLIASHLAYRHAGFAGHPFRLVAEDAIVMLFVLAWNLGSRLFGLYDTWRIHSRLATALALGKNLLLQLVFVIVILFAYKSIALSRFFVLVYFVLLAGTLLLWRAGSLAWRRWMKRNGLHDPAILIVGDGGTARKFTDALGANPSLRARVKGFIGDRPDPDFPCPYLGTCRRLPALLEEGGIDSVVVALANKNVDKIREIIAVCGNFPVKVWIIPDYFEFMSPSYDIMRFGSFPLISIRSTPLDEIGWRFCKRALDLAITLPLFAFVFSWLWPLLALLIRISSPGPVFFKQERWGIKNRRIICYKFRTMVQESRDVDEHGRYRQATRDDPRVTRVGRFLRASNLDELPQFINVLKGEMSIVGPRPHPTPMNLEAKDSIRHYLLRHLVKPGITGWAQVNGLRGETRSPELLRRRVESDIWYIDHWSLLLDLKILWRSAWLMLRGDPQAY